MMDGMGSPDRRLSFLLAVAAIVGCAKSAEGPPPIEPPASGSAHGEARRDAVRIAALTRQVDRLREEPELSPSEVGTAHRDAAAKLEVAGARVSRHRSPEGESYTRVAFLYYDASGGPRPELLSDLRRLENLREIGLNGRKQPVEREFEVIDALPEVPSLALEYCELTPEALRRLGGLTRLLLEAPHADEELALASE